MENFKKYYSWANIAKGLGIILVIAGHSYPPGSEICKFIFLFHMPLFFLIAGFFFNFEKYENNFKLLLSSSAKRLLLPQLIFLLVIYNNSSLINIPSFLYATGKPITDLNIFPIQWFLFCIFALRIILWCFLKIMNKINLPVIFNILIAFCISYLGTIIGKKSIFLPWSIDIAMAALYISYMGFLLKHYNFFKIKKIYHIIFCLFFIIYETLILKYCSYQNYGLSMNERFYSNPLISINSSILLSVLLIYLSMLIEKFGKFPVTKYLNIILQYFGMNSIIVYLFHTMASSSHSSTLCMLFRIFFCCIVIEILSFIPTINEIFSAKSITKLLKNKTD